MLVTITSYSFPHEAQIARARLEAEGIPAFVADEHTINMQWLYSHALGGVRLQVPEPFAEQALQLLDEDRTEDVVAQEGNDQPACTECGSKDFDYLVKGKRIAYLLFIILQFPLWKVRRQLTCRNCGSVTDYEP